MRISLYKTRTYAQLDTWSRRTKQSQTKPISTKKPLPAKHKTSLTSCLIWIYPTTPQSQKRTQTNPIFTKASRIAVQIPRSQTTSQNTLNPSAKCASSGFPAAAELARLKAPPQIWPPVPAVHQENGIMSKILAKIKFHLPTLPLSCNMCRVCQGTFFHLSRICS